MPTPNYGAIVQQAQQRREQAMGRISKLAEARQRFTNQMYQRQEEEMKKAEEERKKYGSGSWRSMLGKSIGGALTGATTGFIASGFNPMGALAGAGLGVGAGFVGGLGEKYLGTDMGASNLAPIAGMAMGDYMKKRSKAEDDYGDAAAGAADANSDSISANYTPLLLQYGR